MSAAAAVEGVTRFRRRGQVMLPNETVYDSAISYAALGILAILLARPDEAPKGYRNLLRPDAGVGQASILRALRELNAAGYRYQFLRTSSTTRGKATVVTDTYISDSPITLEQARAWHREATGQEPISPPDRTKTKRSLASVSDAHNSDAHSSDAHNHGAQTKDFPGSSKLSRENQGGAAAAEAGQPQEQAKWTAGADTPAGSVGRYTGPAAEDMDAVDAERIHCLGCDHTYYRVELDAGGQCPGCARAQLAELAAAAQPVAEDPSKVAELAEQARRASLERQAKRRRITVEQLLAERQPRT